MASKDWVDAQVLTAAPPFTTAPPRGIHRLACAHPYARARSLSRPRLTWHELEKSKYAPIAKWVHAGADAPSVATELLPAPTVMKALTPSGTQFRRRQRLPTGLHETPPNAAHGIPEAPVAAHPFPTNDPCSRPSERAHSYHGSFPAPLHTLTSARPKRPCHDIGPHSRCAGISDRGPTKSSTAALVLTAVLSPPPLTISGISSLLAPKSLLARFGPLNLTFSFL